MKEVTLVFAVHALVGIFRVRQPITEDDDGFNGLVVIYGPYRGEPNNFLPWGSGGAVRVEYTEANVCKETTFCTLWNDWSALALTPKNNKEVVRHGLFITALTEMVRMFVTNPNVTGAQMCARISALVANDWDVAK